MMIISLDKELSQAGLKEAIIIIILDSELDLVSAVDN